MSEMRPFRAMITRISIEMRPFRAMITRVSIEMRPFRLMITQHLIDESKVSKRLVDQ